MRREVKVGIVISALVVTLVGGYFLFQGGGEAPIPVAGSTGAGSSDTTASKLKEDSKPADAQRPSKNKAQTNPGLAQNNRDRRVPARDGGSTGAAVTPVKPNARLATQTGEARPPTASGMQNPATGGSSSPPVSSAPSEPPLALAPPTSTTVGTNSPSGSPPQPVSRIADSGSPSPRDVSPPVSSPVSPASANPVQSNTVASNENKSNAIDGASAARDRSQPVGPLPATRAPRPSVPSSVTTSGNSTSAAESDPASKVTAKQPDSSNPPMLSPPSAPAGRTTTPATGGAASAKGTATESHRVQPGDTFASIALNYYGSEKLAKFLISSNPEIRDPNRLSIGVLVKIPPAPEGALAETATGRSTPNDKAGADRTYRVQPGDSFYSIARNVLGDASRWKELLTLNKDAVNGDATQLQIGQLVKLPER